MIINISKNFFRLYSYDDYETITQAESLEKIKKYVDDNFDNLCKDKIICYELINTDEPKYPLEWDFVYIPKDYEDVEKLKSDGAIIPKKEYWGINLLTVD